MSDTPTPISIVLADDHQVVLAGFRALLGAEPDFEVRGEVTEGLKVLPLVESARPDVLVVDLMMPDLNGLEVVRKVHARLPEVKICVLSMHANEAYVSEALRSGARAYVLKQAPARDLVSAIRAVVAGQRFLSAPLSEQRLGEYERRARAAPPDPYDALTEREREVLQLAAQGLTSQVIGERLGIGKRTVETHRANLLRKLNLKNHAELVRFALTRGLIAG
jgi:DNA-binding NarL/FixJ family response regulator